MNRAKIDFIRKLTAYFESLPFSVSGKNLCVGLSGGADSVSLLLGLLEISDKFGFKVSACHFNHMIRGEEADNDEEFCKALCKKFDVEIYCGRDDVPAYAKLYKLGTEEAARNCRYAFFERIYSKKSVDYCVTAHNKNDDAETLLFNLIRGSGSNGASSVSPYSENILRPLLRISREEIEAYLTEIGQSYVTDSTNSSNEYTRNYIRNVIFPQLSRINPLFVDALSRFADSSRCDREYFDAVVGENIDSALTALPKSIRDRVILKKYKDFSGKALNYDMVLDIERAVFSNKRVCVPLFADTEAIVYKGSVCFCKKNENTSAEYDFQPLDFGVNFVFGDKVSISVTDKIDEFENINKLYTTAFISSDKINGALKVRNRRVGDKILINGINKSLKKLFIDKKVPKEYRDIIPIIFDEEGIIYVPFVGVSDRVCEKEYSKKVYINTVFNTIDKERWSNAYEK